MYAVGAIIAEIVGWVTIGTGTSTTAASGGGSDGGWSGGGGSGGGGSGEGGGVKDWVKKQLFAIGRALKLLSG